jgi:hypothetical protein
MTRKRGGYSTFEKRPCLCLYSMGAWSSVSSQHVIEVSIPTCVRCLPEGDYIFPSGRPHSLTRGVHRISVFNRLST